MNDAPLGQIQFQFRKVHAEVIRLAEGLTDEQLTWQPHPSANPIAFYVWHLARWADYVQTHPAFDQRFKPRREIWHAENLAAQWGLDPASLGELETGWEMDPSSATHMPFPGKVALVDYIKRSYALEEQALTVLDEQLFQEVSETGKMLGYFVTEHLVHEWEHYGMMKYVQGLYELTNLNPAPAKTGKDWLPSACPHCGGAISEATVKWLSRSEAQCPHCKNFIATG
jgi:hypothetical protein